MPDSSHFLSVVWQTALRRPRLILVLALLLLPWMGLQAGKLIFEPRIDLLPADNPLSRAELERQEIFGSDFRVLVALAKPYPEGGLLRPESTTALAELHRKLEALPGVTRVSSLVNAPALVASPGTPAGARVWPGPDEDVKEALLARLRTSQLQRMMFLSLIFVD